MTFSFRTDEESQRYCERIIEAMAVLYDIELESAREMLNEYWNGLDWSANGKHSYLLYHRTEREWADRIGNPCPYGEKKPEMNRWQARKDEADHRIAQLRNAKRIKWLWR